MNVKIRVNGRPGERHGDLDYWTWCAVDNLLDHLHSARVKQVTITVELEDGDE